MPKTIYFRAQLGECECDLFGLPTPHVTAQWLYGNGDTVSGGMAVNPDCYATRELAAAAAVGYDGWHSPSFDGDYVMAMRSV